MGGRANASAFLDRGPYIHWFTSEEARALLEATGFSIVFSAGEPGDDSNAHREQDGWDTGMYFVCTKR